MNFTLDKQLLEQYPGTTVALAIAKNVSIYGPDEKSDQILTNIYPEVIKKYTLDQLKNHPHSQAYINFAKKLGISPDTASLPHLQIKRVLKGKNIGNINNIVNAYMALELMDNLSFSAYDLNTIKGDVITSLAKGGEQMTLIGGGQVTLKSGDFIMSDSQGPFYSFSEGYRDSSKVTPQTKEVLFALDAPEGIASNAIVSATKTLIESFTNNTYFILDQNNPQVSK
jgi:DNA/RNA-binding domain of Phe-tRNA-synthetase-like protein